MACFHSQQLILWATSWLKKNLLLTKVRWLIDITLTAERLVMTMMDQWRWNIFFSSRHNIDTSSFQQQACQARKGIRVKKSCQSSSEFNLQSEKNVQGHTGVWHALYLSTMLSNSELRKPYTIYTDCAFTRICNLIVTLKLILTFLFT